MKKTVLHTALFALTLPMSVYALGLGAMKVESFLDQPFQAEIELIDVGSAALSSIRVNLADPENFERVGIERVAVLSFLSFKVDKNAQGKFVIKVQSVERMTEPYMELVVDLAWPNGQLFKAYTVLLDPPGYQLLSSNQQNYPVRRTGHSGERGVVDKTIISSVDHNPVEIKDSKFKTTYGPTITNENVWQIAQHYKTSEVILPQVVLAIVGANPEAFTDGNLNGLKVGVRLTIPATHDMQEVPVDLATQEVMAHDAAWNDKKSINHVITPPYMGYKAPQLNEPAQDSELPSVPKFTQQVTPSLNSLSQLINVNSVVQVDKKEPPKQIKTLQTDVRESTTTAEIAITTAAVESVRESNALLMEQLHLIQEQNKKLQDQLDKREKDLELIRTQMQVMTKERQSVASEASTSPNKKESSSLWPIFLFLVGACGGGGAAFWYLKRRDEEGDDSSEEGSSPVEPKPFIPQLSQDTKKSEEVEYVQDTMNNTDSVEPSEPSEPSEVSEVLLKPTKAKINKKKIEPQSAPIVEVVAPLAMMEQKEVQPSDDSVTEMPILEFEQHLDSQPVDDLIKIQTNTSEVHSLQTEQIDAINAGTEEANLDKMLEFESGLHHLIQDTPVNNVEKSQAEEMKEKSDSLDFETALPEEVAVEEDQQEEAILDPTQPESDIESDTFLNNFFVQPPAEVNHVPAELSTDNDEFRNIISSSTSANPLKSSKALDTLLSLAKTYIGMDDFESAKHSLEEVIEHGNETQKEEAKRILEELKGQG